MAKIWKNAVVGTGVVGEWHVRVVNGLDNAELVAVCDVDPAQSRKALEKNDLVDKVPAYATLKEMFERHPDLEVVHVCTPSGNHLEPAIEAMRAGRHVICEKPLEIKIDRIDQMIAAAEENKVRLAGIFQNRYRAEMQSIHRAAAEGRFGTVAFAGCYTPWWRSNEYYEDGGWRGTWRLDGGGAIMNQSVHAVDLIQWIAGPIRIVTAHMSSRVHPKIEVEDTLACSLTFESGAHGVIMGTTAMYPGGGVRIEIGGDNGMAQTGGGTRVFKFRQERPEDAHALEEKDSLGTGSSGGGADPADVPMFLHRRNIRDILNSWADGREAMTCGPEARKAVAIINAMYDSARQGGKPVEVPG